MQSLIDNSSAIIMSRFNIVLFSKFCFTIFQISEHGKKKNCMNNMSVIQLLTRIVNIIKKIKK